MAADGFPVEAEEAAWHSRDATDHPPQANGDSSSNGELMPLSQAFTDRSAAGSIAAAQQAIVGRGGFGITYSDQRCSSLSLSQKQRGASGIASRSKSVASDYRSTSRTRPRSSMALYDMGDSESSTQDTANRLRDARLRASKDLPRVENGLIRIPRRQSSIIERPRSVMSQRRPSEYGSGDLYPRNEPETHLNPVSKMTCSGESGSESTKASCETYTATLPGVSNPRSVRGEDLESDSRPDRSMSSTPVGLVRLDEDTVSRYETRRRNSYSSISSRISVPASYTSTVKRPKTPGQARPHSMLGPFSRYDTSGRHQSPRRNPSVHVLPYVDENGDWVEFDGDAQVAANGGGSIMLGMSGISRRPSVTIKKIPSQNGSLSSGGSSRLPDFFSQQVFQVVLHNPATAHHLLKFSENRVCSENVEFLAKIEQYHTTLNQLAEIMTGIHKTYMTHQSPHQLNVPGKLLKEVHKRMKSIVMTKLPAMEALFTEMEVLVEQLVFTDIYPRFVNHQLTLNASKALANDRSKFQGLGDCFCLTNPGLADNPIMFASDGLIKVTGYSRTEIISRNCRFLQGKLTDPVPVRRLRNAMIEGREAVELLLNYKKNGDPFWNLLYIAPLIGENGEVAFWLGGQINCSSTIHNSADVMRVLSTSKSDGNELFQANQNSVQPRTSFSKTLLRALGLRNDNVNPLKSAPSFDMGPVGGGGMEQDILGRMEGHDLPTQIKEFYTAYSKYIVVRADSFVVHFYSQGVADVLHPLAQAHGNTSNSSNYSNGSTLALDKNNSNNSNGNGTRRMGSHESMVGSDVFKFLKSCMIGPSAVTAAGDYKSRVRSCVRAGHSVSVDLRLQTRRSAKFRGDEAFVVHWTPLKDERAVAHWVIVTLVPTIP